MSGKHTSMHTVNTLTPCSDQQMEVFVIMWTKDLVHNMESRSIHEEDEKRVEPEARKFFFFNNDDYRKMRRELQAFQRVLQQVNYFIFTVIFTEKKYCINVFYICSKF